MKKTRIAIIIVAVLLIILLIPIPSGTSNDGGSREFTALTYKIVRWNHIVDADETYTGTDFYLLPDNFKSLSELWYDKTLDLGTGQSTDTNSSTAETDHTHQPAKEEQTVSDPFVGYCGNTQTTIYFEENKSYTFMSGNSVTVTDILLNLDYDTKKLCKCLPEYKVDTEFGLGYGINLTEGYARYDKGQAELTQEQIDKLKEIILWAKNEAGLGFAGGKYPNYSFSLTWGTYGISSYDSKTGTLIKTKDATNPKDYTTNLKLTEQQYSAIWKLIKSLDIDSYPDKYNPHKNGASTPYMTLILSVKSDDIDKTVTVEETILSYDANNKKGQKFLDVCKGIEEILTETNEWKSLPEYEFLYDQEVLL